MVVVVSQGRVNIGECQARPGRDNLVRVHAHPLIPDGDIRSLDAMPGDAKLPATGAGRTHDPLTRVGRTGWTSRFRQCGWRRSGFHDLILEATRPSVTADPRAAISACAARVCLPRLWTRAGREWERHVRFLMTRNFVHGRRHGDRIARSGRAEPRWSTGSSGPSSGLNPSTCWRPCDLSGRRDESRRPPPCTWRRSTSVSYRKRACPSSSVCCSDLSTTGRGLRNDEFLQNPPWPIRRSRQSHRDERVDHRHFPDEPIT